MNHFIHYTYSIDDKGIYILNNLTFPVDSQLDFFPHDKYFKQIKIEQLCQDTTITNIQFTTISMSNNLINNIYYYYNYYFLKMLHTLMTYSNRQYLFSSVNNPIFNNITINEQIVFCTNTIRENKYLSDPNKKFITLSEDILKNGMFFPFYIKQYDTRTVLCGGMHRFTSLKYNPNAINHKFLFIDITDIGTLLGAHKAAQTKIFDIINTNFNNQQTLYLLSDNKVYTAKTKNIYLYYVFFRIITEKIVSYLNLYPKAIVPHPVFNNEKTWEKFINSPFQEIAELENFQ